MTEFEQQVAEALRNCTVPAGPGRIWDIDEQARRVAAAIVAVAHKLGEAVENEHGMGRVPDGSHYQQAIAEAKQAALAALRGEP